MTNFKECNWWEFYGKVAKAIPTDVPEPLGKDVDLRMMVDSDHAGDKETQRSRTGFLIFCNNAIIDWLSKKTADHQVVCLWSGVCCDEAWDGKITRTMIQDTNDGCALNRALLHLW